MTDKRLYRILDANFNRAKEGLRVCEDICRYVRDDKALTRSLKTLRHDLTQAVASVDMLKALASRDIAADVGKATSASEAKRPDLDAVFWANAQRVKESLRVLEEIIKLLSPKTSTQVKHLRYRFYAIEQKALRTR